MKKTIVWSLAIWVCSASLLVAQTPAQVQKAELAIPFGTVSGKISEPKEVEFLFQQAFEVFLRLFAVTANGKN